MGDTKTKALDVERVLQNIWIAIGIDPPANIDEIVSFVLEDVRETAGTEPSSEDIRIGFRRYLERDNDDFPAFITVACEDRLGQCEYIRRGLAEKRVDDLQQRISELEAALKSATPVYRQTSDTLSEIGVIIESTVMYYRIEPDVLKAALEQPR